MMFQRVARTLVIAAMVTLIALGGGKVHAGSGASRVVGISEEGNLDAAFGRALLAAREKAKATGDKAFEVEYIGGLRNIDGSLNELTVGFKLLREIHADVVARATGQVTGSLGELVNNTKPPLELQRDASEIADAPAEYRIRMIDVFGLLEEGGVPPLLYAITEATDVPPLSVSLGRSKYSSQARWVWSGTLARSDWQVDLDESLREADTAMPASTKQFRWHSEGWYYRIGGTAGFNDIGMLIEATDVLDVEFPDTPCSAPPDESGGAQSC